MLFICEHGHPVYRTVPCHARFEVDCPYCSEKWRKKVRKNFVKRIRRMQYPALVTLTFKKGGKHSLTSLNGLTHKCRKNVRRKKKDKKRCEKCKEKRQKEGKKDPSEKVCRKCSNTYDIRSCVSCLEPPNHVHAVWDCDYIPHKKLANLWEKITEDSFIVDLRMVDEHRWWNAVYYISKYITKICESGSAVDLSGVHVVNSWGKGGGSKKFRMVCKLCGSYFEPLWYSGQVDDYDNDDVKFVEIDNDYG